jgi:hypothetical protein
MYIIPSGRNTLFQTAINASGREMRAKATIGGLTILSEDIQSLTVDEGIISSSDFKLGNAVSSSFEIKIANGDSKYTPEIFNDSVITLYIGVVLGDASTEYVPMGVFNIDTVSKEKTYFTCSGNDNMIKFEKPWETSLTYPVSLFQILSEVCSKNSIELVSSSFANSSTLVTKPTETLTYRQVIQYIAEVAGGFARIARDGKLEIVTLSPTLTDTYNNSNTYNMKKSASVIGPLDTMEVYYNALSATVGSSTQENKIIVIEKNPFMQTPEAMINATYNKVNGLTYLPFTASVKLNPSAQAGDYIKIEDYSGVHYSYITKQKVTFSSNTTKSEFTACGRSITATSYDRKGTVTNAINNQNDKIDNVKTEVADVKVLLDNTVDVEQLQVVSDKIDALHAEYADIDVLRAGVAEIGQLKADYANITTLKADKAYIESLYANTAKITDLYAYNASIDNLNADVANIKNLTAGSAFITNLNATYAKITNLTAANANITQLQADYASINTLKATTAYVNDLYANTAKIADLTASNANITTLTAKVASIENLTANTAFITNLNAKYAKITDLTATNASITNLDSKFATITNLNATNASITNLDSKFATIFSLNATNAAITNLASVYAKITSLDVINADIVNLEAKYADIESLKAGSAFIINLDAKYATISKLTAEYATFTWANAKYATITNLNATNGTITNLSATVGDIITLKANTAFVSNLNATFAKVTSLSATNANITTLNTKYAAIENLTAGTVFANNLTAKYATVENLNATNASITNLDSKFATIDNLIATNALITSLDTKYATITSLTAVDAKINNLDVTYAKITDLVATNASIINLDVKFATIASLNATNATITNLNSLYAKITDLSAMNATITNLAATYATINNLVATNAAITNLTANTATIAQLNAVNARITTLVVDNAMIKDATITNAKIADATITNAKIANATIGTAQIANAAIGTAQIQNAAITTALIKDAAIGTTQIANGSITDAKIVSLTADKVVAGSIDTSKVTVMGTNGKLKISNNRLQVFDTQAVPKERVSLGDVNGDGTLYGFRVRGADGTTVLLDETGVKREGITDGSITNAKISSTADISGTKLLDNSTPGGKIVVDSITAREIAAKCITANEIKAQTITAAEIAVNTITANQIKTGTITADSAIIASINASVITTGYLTATRIKGGSLTLGGLLSGNGTMEVLDEQARRIVNVDETGIRIASYTVDNFGDYNVPFAVYDANNTDAGSGSNYDGTIFSIGDYGDKEKLIKANAKIVVGNSDLGNTYRSINNEMVLTNSALTLGAAASTWPIAINNVSSLSHRGSDKFLSKTNNNASKIDIDFFNGGLGIGVNGAYSTDQNVYVTDVVPKLSFNTDTPEFTFNKSITFKNKYGEMRYPVSAIVPTSNESDGYYNDLGIGADAHLGFADGAVYHEIENRRKIHMDHNKWYTYNYDSNTINGGYNAGPEKNYAYVNILATSYSNNPVLIRNRTATSFQYMIQSSSVPQTVNGTTYNYYNDGYMDVVYITCIKACYSSDTTQLVHPY